MNQYGYYQVWRYQPAAVGMLAEHTWPAALRLPGVPILLTCYADPPPSMPYVRDWRAINQAHIQAQSRVYQDRDGLRVYPQGWRVQSLARAEYQMFPPRPRDVVMRLQGSELDPGLEFRDDETSNETNDFDVRRR